MATKSRRILKKPLSAWTDAEILSLVDHVAPLKGTEKAQPFIKKHMSLGSYARALRRVGLRPPLRVAAADPCICRQSIELGDLMQILLEAARKPGLNQGHAHKHQKISQ